jgi:hypothetical protein
MILKKQLVLGHFLNLIIALNLSIESEMNSSQINFFIIPEDWQSIEAFIERNNIAIVYNPITIKEGHFLKNISEETKLPSQIYLTHTNFEKNIVVTYLAERKTYFVDVLKSYVVEFSRGGFYANDQENLNRGRLYYTRRYFVSNGETVIKDDCFIDWADKLIKSFKKEFLKKINSEKHIYFSEKTLKWMSDNNGTIDRAGLKIETK